MNLKCLGKLESEILALLLGFVMRWACYHVFSRLLNIIHPLHIAKTNPCAYNITYTLAEAYLSPISDSFSDLGKTLSGLQPITWPSLKNQRFCDQGIT